MYTSPSLGAQRYLSFQKIYDALAPLSNGTASEKLGTIILGNRHYELTNHLGNVMATILDRSTPRLNEAKTALVGYSADISSAQDYFPFGMLMPGRYISDNSPQCITTQQTTLVPRTVRVYIELTPAPHLPFPGGPIIATPYPWGPIKDLPIEASFRQQQARFNHYLPAEEHPGGFAARALPGGGGYELDLSDEPSGLSLYLPFGIDTGGSQVLGFGVGMLPAGVRLEARVRHYGADSSSEEYTEPVRWRNVRAGEQVELRFGLPAGAAGKLVAELRFSAEGGAGKFGSGRRVEIRDPWIEKTEWSTESRLVTLCDEKDKYRYGFNGMEKDNEVKGLANSLDFGARIYDSRLGRFLSLDPLATKYPALSPYNFVANNPIIFIDPDGKKIVNGEVAGSKRYEQMETLLKIVKQTNSDAYEKVDASPINVIYIFKSLNAPSTGSMPDTRKTGVINFDVPAKVVHNGKTLPVFVPDNSIRGIGNIQKDSKGNITGGSLLRQRTGDGEQDQYREDFPNDAENAHKEYLVSDEVAAEHLKVVSVGVEINEDLASDREGVIREGGKTVAHELGHAFNALFNTVKDYIWSRKEMGSTGRHGDNDPSGQKANTEEETYKKTYKRGLI